MGPYGRHVLDDEDIDAVVEVLRARDITQGCDVEEFEKSLADYTGAKYCVAVSSGTAALQLSVVALGIKSGDEVITTPITFCATVNAIVHQGACVRLVDIDKSDLNINPELIEGQLNSDTKAIIPVDFRGHPADMPRIKEIADTDGLLVIEDASHSLGSTYLYDGKKFVCGDGIHTDLATLSFHPVKHITTAEGGAVLTNNEAVYRKIKSIRSHGIVKSQEMLSVDEKIGDWIYDVQDLGYNYRLTDIQAALGKSQLKKIDRFKSRRRAITNYYNERLAEVEELVLPYESTRVDSNFHIYVLQVRHNKHFDRYDLYMGLREKNYQPMVHYIPIHLHSYYQQKYGFKRGDYPVAEEYYDCALTIPLYPSLTDYEVDQVVKDIKSIIYNLKKNDS